MLNDLLFLIHFRVFSVYYRDMHTKKLCFLLFMIFLLSYYFRMNTDYRFNIYAIYIVYYYYTLINFILILTMNSTTVVVILLQFCFIIVISESVTGNWKILKIKNSSLNQKLTNEYIFKLEADLNYLVWYE